MSSEPTTHRVWRALSGRGHAASAVAADLGIPYADVTNALRKMTRTGAVVRTPHGYVRGNEPRPPGKPRSRDLSAKQRTTVERCASLYGATLAEVATAIGLGFREASWVTEGLVRRRVLERTIEGRVVRERDRPRRCNCYRLTEFGWELLTAAEVSHAAE